MNRRRIEAYEDLKAALLKCHEAGMPISVANEYVEILDTIAGVSIGETIDGRKGIVLENTGAAIEYKGWGEMEFDF